MLQLAQVVAQLFGQDVIFGLKQHFVFVFDTLLLYRKVLFQLLFVGLKVLRVNLILQLFKMLLDLFVFVLELRSLLLLFLQSSLQCVTLTLKQGHVSLQFLSLPP